MATVFCASFSSTKVGVSASSQYQQKPYVHMNDEKVRGGWFAQPDQFGFPMGAMCKVPETAILAYELFGIGDRHPATRPRPM